MYSIRVLPYLFIILSVFSACKHNDTSDKADQPYTIEHIIDEYSKHLRNGDTNKAIFYLDSAVNKQTSLTPLDKWHIYSNKSLFYLKFGNDLKKATLYTDSMDMFVAKLNYQTPQYLATVFSRGEILLATKNYDKALEKFHEVRLYAAKNIDKWQLARYSVKLGEVKIKQEKPNDAIKYFKQALTELKSCPDKTFKNTFYHTQLSLNSIGVLYEKQHRLDDAVNFYNQGIEFVKSAKPLSNVDSTLALRSFGVLYGNLGGVYFLQKNYINAEKLLLQSIAVNDRPGFEVQDAMTAKIKLAQVYLATGRPKLCLSTIKKVISDASSIGGDTLQKNMVLMRCYLQLKNFYEYKGSYKEALKAQDKYILQKDLVDATNQGLKSTDIEMTFQLSEQRYKAEVAKKESEIKTLYIIGIAIILVLTLLVVVFLLRDTKKSHAYINKLKKLNLHNQQTLAALEISHAENDKIMRIVAHDLRNPLSGISGVVALMLEEEGFSEESKEELALIKSTSDNSLALVNELLQINSRMEGIDMSPVDIGGLVQYCSDLLKIKAETKNQQIITQSFECYVLANREKLWRVLGNLIGNAIKFSPQHGIITVNMTKNDLELIVSVSDQGIGIPNQMAAKLFEMFTPAKRLGTSGEESFGMGLSIAKKIIEGHSGKIWFESEDGKGATFYFSLPIYQLSV